MALRFIPIVLLVVFVVGSLSSKPHKFHVREGENLLHRCSASAEPGVFVYWSKNDTKSSFRQNSTDLSIVDIRRNFSGEYVCHALNTSYPVGNETEANVTVEVIEIDVEYPAEVPYFTLSSTDVAENQTFTISCGMMGNPEPTWSVRNQNTDETLMSANVHANLSLFVKARCESGGFWACTGYNKLNKDGNATKGEALTVQCSPRPQWSQQYRVETSKGRSVEIRMNLWAYPRPKYTWRRGDGSRVSASQSDTDTSTTIYLSDVQISDLGNYTLTMSNEHGSYHALFNLVADGPPETPTQLTYSDVTYNSVRLNWTSGYDMGSPQHFVIMSLVNGNTYMEVTSTDEETPGSHGVGKAWSFVVTGLYSSNYYRLMVVSRNREGHTSEYSNEVNLITDGYPYPDFDYHHAHTGTIVGITLGSLGTVATLAFLLYILKWRKMRTSYAQSTPSKSNYGTTVKC